MSEQNKITIQEKTDKLSELVSWFDGEDFDIELALEKFKAAEKLASEIEGDLMSLKNDVQVLKQKFDSEQ